LCNILSFQPHPSEELHPEFPSLEYKSPFGETVLDYVKVTEVDSVSLKVYYQRNQTDIGENDKDKIYNLIPLNAKIKKIKIQAFDSIEGTEALNKSLFSERALQLQETLYNENLLTEDVLVELNTQENWKVMRQQIDQNPSFQSLVERPQAAIRAYFNNHRTDSLSVKSLDAQRYADITVFLTYERWTQLEPKALLDKYDSLISSAKKLSYAQIRQLASIQEHYYEELISSNEEDDNKLVVSDEDKFSELKYKEALFNYLYRKSISEPEFIRLIGQIGSTPKIPKALLNKLIRINLIAVTKQLFGSRDLNLEVRNLICKAERDNFLYLKPLKEHEHQTRTRDLTLLSLDVIPKLIRYERNNSEIQDLIKKAELFHLITKAQHLRSTGNIAHLRTINKLMKTIWYEHVLKNELSDQGVIDYAMFFNLFKKYKYAKKIVRPLVEKENSNHQALMIWISLLVQEKTESELVNEIIEAKEILSPVEWIQLISSGSYLSYEFLERSELRHEFQKLIR
jgi:hypothetical protein